MFKMNPLLFVIIALISYPLHLYSISVNPKDIAIGLTALAVGAVGSAIGSNYYHPAALEKVKFKQDQEDKQKKERLEKIEKEKQMEAELEKLHAINALLQVEHTYAEEFKNIRIGKLNEKGCLLQIIKGHYGMQTMPLNYYYALLSSNIENLKTIEGVLPPEKKELLTTTVQNLMQILKTFNNTVSDNAKQEKEDFENIQRREEAEHRKIAKEKLEEKKLRLEIDTIKETAKKLDVLQISNETITKMIVLESGKASDRANDIISSIESLKRRQSQSNEEIKALIGKGNAANESKFAMLFKLFEQARTYISQVLSAQAQSSNQPPPSFVPEGYQTQPTFHAQPSVNPEYSA